MVQTVQLELSINSNATRSQILINAYVTGHLRDMFYDPKTQFINLADWQSGWKSPLNNLQTRLKKGKEYRSVGNELSIKDNIKASNINLASVSVHLRKNCWIYWLI